MASQGDANMVISGNEETNSSGTTVEIKIKTLDSQTYTLQVDKCVPVPALKEQIALVTGILSEQQRLICRGKVLNDDQLLSAYHVEDGHTLHLVVRQPVVPSSESSPDPATDSTSASGHRHVGRGPGILVGSFNITEQDGAFPDLSRVVSAVLGSFGIPGSGNAGEEIDLNVLPTERLYNTSNVGRNSSTHQSGQGGSRIQSSPSRGAFPHQSGESSDSMLPPVIPDSISTLSLNLGRLRQEFSTTADEHGYSSQSSSTHVMDGQNSHAALDEQRGLPTPAALGDVMLTARQILHEQASGCLLQLSRQLQGQANVIDVSERSRIQSNAVRSGLLFQNLGTMLLELGRTMMTVRMGNSLNDSVVNAGPAVFLSSAGPNPIMVQPLPFQPGASLEAFSGRTQQSAGLAGGSVGSGVRPRNIDIRIRTVGSFVPLSSIQRDLNGSQNAEQGAPVAPDDDNMGQLGDHRGSGTSATMESQVRVVPLRTMIAAVPASGERVTSDASRSGMEILYPVLSRFQHSHSGNSGSTAPGAPQANDQHHTNGTGSIPVPVSAVEHRTHIIPEIDHGSSFFTEMSNGQGMPEEIQRGFDRLLQTMFHGENLPGGSNNQDVDTNFVNAPNSESSPAAETGSAAATPSEEGVFLSNILQHIMPWITENVGSNLPSSSSYVHTVADGNRLDSVQAGVDVNGGTPSRQRDDPETSDHTNPKRQKMD